VINVKTIKEKMEVLGSDGQHVGVVDHLDGTDKIKLTESNAKSGGKHHIIPLAWVDKVDAQVHLNKNTRDAITQRQATA
jgi:hypothetical protein